MEKAFWNDASIRRQDIAKKELTRARRVLGAFYLDVQLEATTTVQSPPAFWMEPVDLVREAVDEAIEALDAIGAVSENVPEIEMANALLRHPRVGNKEWVVALVRSGDKPIAQARFENVREAGSEAPLEAGPEVNE